MALVEFRNQRKPRVAYLTHWIFEFRLALAALVFPSSDE
jgi:hypothetical protein